MEQKQSRAGILLPYALLFLSLFVLCLLFPLIGDDWFREALGRSIDGVGALVREVMNRWRTTNSRILGNVLAYSAAGRPVLRALLRTIITCLMVAAAAHCCGFRSWRGAFLSAGALLALPREMFCEIYPWAAGFFNYVPPVCLLFAAVYLQAEVFSDGDAERSRHNALRVPVLFVLGFAMQLFVEHNTLCAVYLAAVLLCLALWRKRGCAAQLAFLCGTILGALLLFASPSYRLITQGGAYQADLGGGLSGLLATARLNQPTVVRFLIAGCPVLYLSLTVLCLLRFAHGRRRPADWLLAAGLSLGCGYFAFGRYVLPTGEYTELMVAVAWGLLLGGGILRWTTGAARARALFFWSGAAVAAAPLLVVSPIGPRCLFCSYAFLLTAAGNLLSEELRQTRPFHTAAALFSYAAVLGFFLYIFLPIHALEGERAERIAAAMAAHETQIVLPAYPEEYLWEGNHEKIASAFYYETPGDITFIFQPQSDK